MVSVTIYGSTLPGSNKYTAYPDGGDNRIHFRWYKNGEYAGLGQEVVISTQYNDIINVEFMPFYLTGLASGTHLQTVGSNRIRIGKTETIVGVIEPPPVVPLPVYIPVVTISGSSVAKRDSQTYTATISNLDPTSTTHWAIEWYINDKKQWKNLGDVPTTQNFVMTKPGDVIYVKFYKDQYNLTNAQVESNRITLTDEAVQNIIDPPPAPLITPTEEVKGIIEPPPVPPPAPAPLTVPAEEVKGIIEPPAPNVGIGFPSNILTPPIPPSKPEPESMNSIIMPPPMFPPMLPPSPMASPIASPIVDNITPYIPFIIGGVLLYILFF